MKEMRLTVSTAEKEPEFKKTAGMLLTLCRDYFQNPENEKEYQEWQRSRNKKAV